MILWLSSKWLQTISLTSHKQVDAAGFSDLLLVGVALGLQVFSVPVQDVGVGRLDVDVLEEVVPHVRVVALGMGSR